MYSAILYNDAMMQKLSPQKLSPMEQQALRARAHVLNPVVIISEKGLSEAVLVEIDRSLKAHELIKIRVFGDDREQRSAAMETICTSLDALPVQQIGKVLVIYRKNPEAIKKPAATAKRLTKPEMQDKPALVRRRPRPETAMATPRADLATRRRKA